MVQTDSKVTFEDVCSLPYEQETHLQASELPQKNTFIDYPPSPMADPGPPTTSAPAFLQRFRVNNSSLEPSQDITLEKASEQDGHSEDNSSTDCPPDSLVEEEEKIVTEVLAPSTSVGSATHGDGKCSPCAWYWKAGGCRSEANCTHCHLCPKNARATMKKAKIAVLKAQAAAVAAQESGVGPAYIAMAHCSPIVSILEPSDEPLIETKEKTEADATNQQDPVKLSVKNTFLQLEMDTSPTLSEDRPVPLQSAPGDFFKRLFRTIEPVEASPSPNDLPTPTSSMSKGLLKRPVQTDESLETSPAFLPTPTSSMSKDFFKRFSPSSEAVATPSAFLPTPTPGYPTPSYATPGCFVVSYATPSFGLLPGMMNVPMVPYTVDLEVPSNSKQDHMLGKCTPCAYFAHKKDGCRQGDACEFCHLCTKGEIKRRKKERIHQLKASGAYIPGFSALAKVQD